MHGRCYNAGAAQAGSSAYGKSGYYGPFHHGHYGAFYRRPKYNVPLNIIENEADYEVHVYALGFDKENIKITVSDDVLYISGTRTIDENYKPNFTRQEFPIKTFERVLNLHGQVDTSAISARQEQGVLKITLPKTPEAQKPEQEIKVI